jgi:hypothetical protein
VINAEEVPETEISAISEKASRYTDPLSVKPRHRVMLYTNIAFIAANIVSGILSLIPLEMMIFSSIPFIISIINAKFPKILWEFEKLTLRLVIADAEEAAPSWWWVVGRELAIFGAFIAGVLLLGYFALI